MEFSAFIFFVYASHILDLITVVVSVNGVNYETPHYAVFSSLLLLPFY
jgi:hypothetical protein